MDLKNAICVVTGATEGIGRAIAEALGQRGARLAICARTVRKVQTTVRQLKEAGFNVVGNPCDVSDESSVRKFASFVHGTLGPVRVLINNAGLGHFVPLEDMTLRQFDETYAVNVRGVFLLTKAFLPDMKKAGAGDIVNISSLAGRNPVADGAAYSASKHAVLGLSKSLMLEVRKHGIRVTAVCPGSVVTPFFDKSGWELKNPDRVLQPEDVAHAVVAALEVSDRAMISELDIRPTNP